MTSELTNVEMKSRPIENVRSTFANGYQQLNYPSLSLLDIFVFHTIDQHVERQQGRRRLMKIRQEEEEEGKEKEEKKKKCTLI
jgi:hypothetical protein